MATDFTEETAADAVIESFAPETEPRLREVLTSLVRHLHAFARDVELTIPEWEKAIDFLTRTGQKSDDERQEFILLSDVLGLSMLVETISNRKFGVATESTVLGPFHVVESPVRALGDNIDLVGTGTPCVVTGRVVSVDGTPLPGATLDVWQANDQGFYDVQQPGVQPRTNGRGLFTADEKGEFWFRTIVPSYYPIPTDGPVGELLVATGRHAFRPAHIHFIVTAPGHRDLTTHIFVAGSEYIESDTVFAVKKSLVVDFEEVTDEELAERWGVAGPVPPRRLRHRHAAEFLTSTWAGQPGRRGRDGGPLFRGLLAGRYLAQERRHQALKLGEIRPGSGNSPATNCLLGPSKSPSVMDFAVNAVSPLAHFPSAKAMSASGPGESSATRAASTFAVSACSWMAARRTFMSRQ